ncbi:uncharacterized protein A4U43_C08F6640 [Asparagus officinalis]|nr:uncharacterized protein A4U43_C08F6640 [Asparagus officinalis]
MTDPVVSPSLCDWHVAPPRDLVTSHGTYKSGKIDSVRDPEPIGFDAMTRARKIDTLRDPEPLGFDLMTGLRLKWQMGYTSSTFLICTEYLPLIN